MTSNSSEPTTNGPRPIDRTEVVVVTFLDWAGPQKVTTIAESIGLRRNVVEYALANLMRSKHVRLGALGDYLTTSLFDPDLDDLASVRP